jgi:hypothetical protein
MGGNKTYQHHVDSHHASGDQGKGGKGKGEVQGAEVPEKQGRQDRDAEEYAGCPGLIPKPPVQEPACVDSQKVYRREQA